MAIKDKISPRLWRASRGFDPPPLLPPPPRQEKPFAARLSLASHKGVGRTAGSVMTRTRAHVQNGWVCICRSRGTIHEQRQRTQQEARAPAARVVLRGPEGMQLGSLWPLEGRGARGMRAESSVRSGRAPPPTFQKLQAVLSRGPGWASSAQEAGGEPREGAG